MPSGGSCGCSRGVQHLLGHALGVLADLGEGDVAVDDVEAGGLQVGLEAAQAPQSGPSAMNARSALWPSTATGTTWSPSRLGRLHRGDHGLARRRSGVGLQKRWSTPHPTGGSAVRPWPHCTSGLAPWPQLCKGSLTRCRQPVSCPRSTAVGWVALIGLVTTAVAVAVIARGVDGRAVAEAFDAARDRPVPVAVAVATLASAFVVRAWAWRRVLPALSLGHSLAGIHLAYGANHVLPLRLGEPLRILSVVRRAGIGVGPATASTVTLRVADLVTLAALGAAAGGTVLWSLAGPWFAVSLTLAAAAGGAAWWWLRRAVKGGPTSAFRRCPVLAATGSAWLLEAVLVMEGAHLVGLSIGYQQALLVTATTVCAQVGRRRSQRPRHLRGRRDRNLRGPRLRRGRRPGRDRGGPRHQHRLLAVRPAGRPSSGPPPAWPVASGSPRSTSRPPRRHPVGARCCCSCPPTTRLPPVSEVVARVPTPSTGGRWTAWSSTTAAGTEPLALGEGSRGRGPAP